MYWDVFKFARQVLFEPRKTLKKQMKVKEAMKYLAVLSIVSAVLTPLVDWALPFSTLTGYGSFGVGLVAIPFFIIAVVVGSVIGAAIIHTFGKLFRLLPKDFSRTYMSVVYGETPQMLLGWIPVVNIFAGIWGLVLEVMALKRQHGISTGRAILAVLIPIIVVVVIAALLAGVAFFYISNIFAGKVASLV